MTGFCIGRVVEPVVREIVVKGKKRSVCSLGLLVGRNCTQFDIFDDSRIFEKVSALEDGDLVLAVVGCSLGDNGRLRNYLNEITYAPEGLREQLNSFFEAK